MPPRDPTLEALWAEVRTDPSPLQTYLAPRPRPIPYRNATPPRPMPRVMRPASARMRDPNEGVRRQATSELQLRDRIQADLPRREAYAAPRNQIVEAGQMALESTGLPSIRRGTANVTRGAINADPNEGLRQTGAGAVELGLGGLGVAGMGAGVPRGGARLPMRAAIPDEPMPRMTPPPREIAPNGMTIRPAEPFRNSLRGGSEDLAEAAGMRTPLFRGSDTGGARGGWATPPRGQQRMPLTSLEEFDPIDGFRPWDLRGASLEDSDVVTALRAGRLKAEPYVKGAPWSAQDHAERIAWLIRNDRGDPITLSRDSVGAAQVEDGYHRLAAARLRGDRDIPIRYRQSQAAFRAAPREIAPNGMTIRPPEPFRNSMRGGSEDLAEAALAPRQAPDAGGAPAPDGGNAGELQPYLPLDDTGNPIASDTFPFGFRRFGMGYRAEQFMPRAPSFEWPDDGVSLSGMRRTKDRVSISSLTPTQIDVGESFLNPTRSRNPEMLGGKRSPFNDAPAIVRVGEDFFVVDGHNRIAEAAARGETEITAHVFDGRRLLRSAPNAPANQNQRPRT